MSDATVTANPSIRKYLDYIDALDAAASDLDEAGFNIAIEAEARRINALLGYFDGAKAAHRLGDFDFYERIVTENPEHLFTEQKPQYALYREALERLKRLQKERDA